MPEINPLPVSEETREELREVKGDEESYDELLQRLVESQHRYDLSERYHEVADYRAENLIGLDTVIEDDDSAEEGADEDGADDSGAADGEEAAGDDAAANDGEAAAGDEAAANDDSATPARGAADEEGDDE